MAFEFLSFNKKVLSIGIDLGADTAKLVCLLSSKNGYKLVAHALVRKDHFLSLKDFLNHPELSQSEVRIAIQDPNIKIQKLSLPIVPREELPQVVSYALRDAINISMDDFVIRFQTGKLGSGPQPQSVTAFAIEKKLLAQWVKFIDDSGIAQPKIAEPDIQSLANVVSYNYGLKEGDRYAVIDIGRTQSQMAVVSQNGIEFYKPFSGIGGEHLANSLSHELGITLEEAEQSLLTISSNGTCPKQDLVLDVISRYCAKFCVQAQYAIESYSTLEKTHPITNIILSGGGAKIKGLKEQIQETLHFPTDLIDPFTHFDLGRFSKKEFEDFKTLYAVAAGLAL